MFCTDGARRGFTVNLYDGEPNWDLWVCSRCLKPTRLVFKGLTGMRCPKDATALLRVFAHKDGVTDITWATNSGRKTTRYFSVYPRKADMHNQAERLMQIWHMLDEAIDGFKASGEDDPSIVRHKHQARCLSEVLFVMMEPFYDSADAVAREGLMRWKARQGDTSHETPGLAEAIWDPDTRWNGTAIGGDAPARTGKPATKPAVKVKNAKPFPVEAVPGAKQAVDSKMMTVEQIARMYDVSVDAVKTALGA